MAEYQEAQKARETKQKEPLSTPKVQKKTKDQKAVICPNCGASVPEGALFCAECGFDLSQPLFCPNCGAKTSPGADICLVCKAWLLEGKCKFCYAEISAEAAFCPECGNPKDGIICPHCGKLSIFDFCPGCGTPVSENALAALEHAKNDPEIKAAVEAVQKSFSINAELAELENVINSEQEVTAEPPPVRRSLFSERQIAAIMKTGENRDAAAQRRVEEEKKKEEAEKKRQEQERLAKIKEAKARKEALEKEKEAAIAELNRTARKVAGKKFLSHQEARRWHIANHNPNAVGWVCNFSDTVHLYPAGPNDCDEPALGGCDYFGETIEVERNGPA